MVTGPVRPGGHNEFMGRLVGYFVGQFLEQRRDGYRERYRTRDHARYWSVYVGGRFESIHFR